MEINELKQLAHAGDAEAQYELGIRYSVGAGVEVDEGEAQHWYILAAKQGLVKAMGALADRDLLRKAIEFASTKHRNQTRKGTDVPYIVHPMEVMHILAINGCSIQVQVAGLLHDTVEDTDTSIEEVETLFGKEIAELVQSDTEDKALSWQERKQITIDNIKHESRQAQEILCADKLSNIKGLCYDLSKDGPSIWSRFKGTPSQTEWYYREIVKELAGFAGRPMYEELKTYVDIVFAKK